jgi:UDP-N-acetylmuramoyl-L-alanyl-D-glutamate--2,6-diaminopimelate ligase
MHKLKSLFPQFLKNWYHLSQAVLANLIYGFPSRKIKVIGVTGTNGKTTTVQMISHILEESGKKVAMASTINFKLGEKEWVNATKYTTLSPFAVQKFILQAVEARCDYLVLETSSHSLDQSRVWGVDYQTVVITNITREHLDYHKTMEKYRAAKMKLFQKAKVAVVNLDMERPEDFLEYCASKIYGYSAKFRISNLEPCLPAGRFPIKSECPNSEFEKVFAEEITLGIIESKFKIQNSKFSLNIPGLFNIENALAATCVGLAEGISLEAISKALEKIQGVPGRLENIPNERGLNIMIDYAVTPDSLEKLYQLVQGTRKENAKIIAVFGSCGERDRGKRPLMGEIVSRYADYIIVTNEDPYHEDPQRIIDEVASGVKNKIEGENFWKIMDRREAIKKALQLVKPGDVVLVTGKGAEETMAIGDQRIPWNDKKVISELLQE